jgi:hypothetical protein
MDPDVERLIEYAATHEPLDSDLRIKDGKGAPVLADAFAMIEWHDHRVAYILIHPDDRGRFLAGMGGYVAGSARTGDPAKVSSLWGAEIWQTTRAPRYRVLLVADPCHIKDGVPSENVLVSVKIKV